MGGGNDLFSIASDEPGDGDMKGIYQFRCWTPCFPQCDAVLVLFAGPTQPKRNVVTDAITEATRKSLSPEAAYLLYPADVADDVANDLEENPEVFGPLAEDTAIGVYAYDSKGTVTLVRSLRGNPVSELPLDHIRRQGLTTLFRRHGGALDAGPTAHFLRPSSRPSTRFLRAALALSDGSEIYFAALWLLPHLSDDIEYIHLDTSAIASVALAALTLKGRVPQPSILTFHSYTGVNRHPFSVDRSDLVLISASQSGTMAIDVCKLVGDSSRVLTLFSSAEAPNNTTVICDIRYDHEQNANGFEPPREIRDTAKTRPIRLISEHFTVEPEPPRAIVPSIKHIPRAVKQFLAQLVGEEVLSALRATELADERLSVWVDMRAFAKLDIFQSWVELVANKSIPATTRAIVHIDDDEQSKILADTIFEVASRHGRQLDPVARLSMSDLESGQRSWDQPGSPIIVTGAVAGRGTQLLAASRALRRFAPDSHRVFLAPATIGLSARSIDLLRSNLKQPTHQFETLFELIIDREACAYSWKDERLLLSDLDRGDLPKEAEERLSSLNGNPDGRINGLFLESPAGEIRLRDNFAFWPEGTPCTEASHADVFTTICVVMAHLRTDAVSLEQRLINDAQTHTVLSVETFSRYNDGIIQASFLRAALPIELNYQDSPAESRLMLDLLRQMIRYRDRQQGEALAEFLLALASGRLLLMKDDIAMLKRELEGGLDGASAISIWLADCILHRSNELPGFQ